MLNLYVCFLKLLIIFSICAAVVPTVFVSLFLQLRLYMKITTQHKATRKQVYLHNIGQAILWVACHPHPHQLLHNRRMVSDKSLL